jgi:hypothetical protein
MDMTSRFDQPSEPDFDRYEFRADEDIDVPDFTAADVPAALRSLSDDGLVELIGNLSASSALKELADKQRDYNSAQSAVLDRILPIDPAEHAMHAVIEALSTLEKEIVTAADLARARTLRRMVRDLWQHVTDVTDRAANKEDELVERLR